MIVNYEKEEPFHDFKKEDTQRQCIELYSTSFSEKRPSEMIVYNWIAEFSLGRESVSDESVCYRKTSMLCTTLLKMIGI